MKKSEITKEAREIIKTIFWRLETKEEYKKAIDDVRFIILPGKNYGSDKFIRQKVLALLTTKYGILFIKQK